MKKTFIVFLGILIIFLSSGCSKINIKEVTLKEIDNNKIKDKKLIETLIYIEDNGIYALETKKRKYIIFNGLENEYKDIEYELKDDVFKIIFKKDNLVEPIKRIYEISPFPSEDYDTILLEQDGESVSFKIVFIKE